ncbi:MAG: hypothetical protein LBD68_06915 [Zoogloeaceae bacterium]|jgi:hypothetical protein|nr:hypothetical protein [Zoogloeaceae bacterium]
MKSIFLTILLCMFLLPSARAEDDALSRTCAKMTGVHAAVSLLESPAFQDLAYELLHPDYVMGNPAFTIAIEGDVAVSTGAMTGNALQMTANDSLNDFFESFGGKIECSLSWEDNRQLSLTRVDLSAATSEQLDGLSKYLAVAWKEKVAGEALRKVEEFMMYEFSMSGATAGVYGLPMQKIAP